jgi:serine/threonine-protein kinase
MVTTDPLVGALLDGRYRVGARIATGGMSTVYRGLDVRLGRPVALKVMDARYAGDQQFLTRFHREARAIASLKHPGLVAIYDQGNDPTHPFLVMELIEGGTLRELLRERGPMPPHAAVAVLRPVLGGLGVAHRAGLVHRDIKPENVLISDDGEVKLVDFGLVRAIAEAGITSTSVILGTAAYLSPEQVLGAETGPRSDVYSAGIMAFELLTGTTPFTGDSAITVANQRLDQDVPPPSSLIDGVPDQFDEFIARATARDPDDRFADAAAMSAELDVIAEELALPQFRVPAPRNSAQHTAAAVAPPVRHPTRQLTRGPQDWQPVAASGVDAETEVVHADEPDEYDSAPRQFAGIDVDEFAWARQRSRRVLTFWVLTVLVLTGLTALAGWELGLNFNGLLGR